MRFQIASERQAVGCFILSTLLGLTLAYGFIPLSYRFFEAISLGNVKELAFAVLSFSFYLSLTDSPLISRSSFTTSRLLTLCVLPLFLSAAFGATKTFEFSPDNHPLSWRPLIWAWFLVPLGEEFLFRGWITAFLNRLNRNTYLGITPLYPLSLWGAAVSFSVWHFQNWSTVGTGFLLFQIFYTFFIGVWLGFLKWQTGKIWPCILAHMLLNLTADWKVWFVL